MDAYGTGAAIRAATELCFQCGQRTGRTTRMVQTVQDGDRVVFSNAKQADIFRRLLREAGKKAECLTLPIDGPWYSIRSVSGKTHLDHQWVEEFYRKRLNEISHEMSRLVEELDRVRSSPTDSAFTIPR